jgi:hypothetical protein
VSDKNNNLTMTTDLTAPEMAERFAARIERAMGARDFNEGGQINAAHVERHDAVRAATTP